MNGIGQMIDWREILEHEERRNYWLDPLKFWFFEVAPYFVFGALFLLFILPLLPVWAAALCGLFAGICMVGAKIITKRGKRS